MQITLSNTYRKHTIYNILKIYAVVGLVILMLYGISSKVPYSIRYVGTPSIPMGIYLIDNRVDLNRLQIGDLVMFRYQNTMFKGDRIPDGMLVLKQLAGKEGDTMIYDPDSRLFSVCRRGGNCLDVGNVLASNSDGETLPQPSFTKRVISDNEFFVYGYASELSFDSRYYGPIAGHRILGTGTPLITF